MKKVILASRSPRREELLGRILEDFEIEESGIDEASGETDPDKLAGTLAERKAADVFSRNRDAVVIGADTVVAADGKLLGKPRDESEARKMIALLAGRTHSVHTGVCVAAEGFIKIICCKTLVSFDEMSQMDIDDYISAGDYKDKAGAYGIQGAAAKYITGICGDYYNVVGLPVHALYKILKEIL
jgi:septum formation protein